MFQRVALVLTVCLSVALALNHHHTKHPPHTTTTTTTQKPKTDHELIQGKWTFYCILGTLWSGSAYDGKYTSNTFHSLFTQRVQTRKFSPEISKRHIQALYHRQCHLSYALYFMHILPLLQSGFCS